MLLDLFIYLNKKEENETFSISILQKVNKHNARDVRALSLLCVCERAIT